MSLRSAPGLVLAYHRVTETPRDPFGLCVRPDRFATHLNVLARLADVVALSEIRKTRRPGRRRIAITFDDGYADNLEVAAPLLVESGFPATFFLVTEGLDPDAEFWWDRLEHVVLDAPEGSGPIEVVLDGRTLRLDTRSALGRERALKALNRRLRLLRPERIDAVLLELAECLGGWKGACEHHRRLAPSRARSLLAAGEIGAHTRTHPLLAALDDGSAREEIAGSRGDAARIAGVAVRHFAYPFGMEGAFDRRIARLVREAGFDAAFINVRGLVRRRTDRFLIPRVAVGDVGGEVLAENVERWFEGR